MGSRSPSSPLPWLLLFPPAVLAWPGPGAPLAGDPFPLPSAVGWASFGALPLALWLVGRRRWGRVVGAGPLLVVAALVALAALALPLPDRFEARRVLVLFATLVVAFLGGSQLDPAGRRRFERGLLALSILWSGAALVRAAGAGEAGLAGVLGNSGALSQAALPGALVGAWILARGRGAWRLAGLAGVALFVAHAALAPVVAGALAFALAAALGAWLTRRTLPRGTGRWIAGCAAVQVLALGALVLARREAPPPAAAQVEAASTDDALDSLAGSLGGFEVRARLWSRVPRMLADAPWLGVGPGQFQARFPPYRDARERELSDHGPDSGTITEVSHAHDDWLQVLAELGWVGGLAWALFLLLGLFAALRVARDEAAELGWAAATLGLLANSLLHAPLSVAPASAFLGCALLGGVRRTARGTPDAERPAWRWRAVALVSLAGPLLGLVLVRHGRALRDYTRAVRRVEAAQRAGDADGARRAAQAALDAIDRALVVAPDSAEAHALRARHTSGAAARADWAAVLERRPHHYEALYATGVSLARDGELARAREALERAHALAPERGPALRGLARVALLQNDVARGSELVEELRRAGRLDRAWLASLGSELVFLGRLEAGLACLGVLDARFRDPVPEALHAASSDEPDALRADALEMAAQLGWARAHVAAGDPALALRNYRQALRVSLGQVGERGVALRLELAAAALLAGREDEARERLAGVTWDATTLEGLPAWARRALVELYRGPER